jgi:hypothetical protein
VWMDSETSFAMCEHDILRACLCTHRPLRAFTYSGAAAATAATVIQTGFFRARIHAHLLSLRPMCDVDQPCVALALVTCQLLTIYLMQHHTNTIHHCYSYVNVLCAHIGRKRCATDIMCKTAILLLGMAASASAFHLGAPSAAPMALRQPALCSARHSQFIGAPAMHHAPAVRGRASSELKMSLFGLGVPELAVIGVLAVSFHTKSNLYIK